MQSQLTLLIQLCDSVAPLALINFIPKIMKSKFIRIRNPKHFCSSQYLSYHVWPINHSLYEHIILND